MTSENPAQTRVLVNQFGADLKAQLGLSETDIMVFNRASDQGSSTVFLMRPLRT